MSSYKVKQGQIIRAEIVDRTGHKEITHKAVQLTGPFAGERIYIFQNGNRDLEGEIAVRCDTLPKRLSRQFTDGDRPVGYLLKTTTPDWLDSISSRKVLFLRKLDIPLEELEQSSAGLRIKETFDPGFVPIYFISERTAEGPNNYRYRFNEKPEMYRGFRGEPTRTKGALAKYLEEIAMTAQNSARVAMASSNRNLEAIKKIAREKGYKPFKLYK